MENSDAASRENGEDGPRDLARPYVTGSGDFNPQAAQASIQGFQAERAGQDTPTLLAGEVRSRRHTKRPQKESIPPGGRRGSLAVGAAVTAAVLAGVILLVLANRTTTVSGTASLRKPPAASPTQASTFRPTWSPVTVIAPTLAVFPGRPASKTPTPASSSPRIAASALAATSTPSSAASLTASTPGLTPGSRISIEATTQCCTTFSIQHDHGDNRVVITQVTAGSSGKSKKDATWIVAPGLANASCVSFESANDLGSYLRHFDFELYLDPNDGSTQFALDATFCPRPGNSGQDYSFQSYNYPSMYIRHFDYVVFIASDGGSLQWDTPTLWPDDTTWRIIQPWG